MENRFGFKDFVLVVLMLAVVVVVIVAMFQYERQWTELKTIDSQLAQMNAQSAQQSQYLRDISKSLKQGITVTGTQPIAAGTTTQPTANGLKDPFFYQKQAAENSDYAEGDWLVSNMGTKIAKITPGLSGDIYATYLQNRVLEQLAYRDPETFEWIPQLATSWKTSDDGLTITFELRQGVQFSDGTPFTADDLVWTFNFIMNPKVDAARARSAYERLESVTAHGDYEVAFKFKEPFFDSFSTAAGTSPMSKKFYSKYSIDDFNKSVGLLIGTGPYRMKDPAGWHPGDPLEMVRNERYWGMPGPFNRLYWYEVEEDAASLTLFRNGEVDTYGATPEQYGSMIGDADLMKKCQSFKFYSRDGGYSYIGWNQVRAGKSTHFADKRVRQAMTMLIDREGMVEDVFHGFAKVASGPYGITSSQNDPNIKPWPYDPKQAIALLATAGYNKHDAQGLLLDPDGKPFHFSLIYSNKSPTTDQMVLRMKDSFARVGIVLDQEPTDWPIMQQKLNTHDFDAIMLGWSGGIETDIYQMFHSSQITDGDNVESYKNPDLDKAIEEARRTLDDSKRMAIWQKCHQILNEDQPYTFLMYRQSLSFIDKRIHNVHETRSGLNYFSDDDLPIPWYVPANLQKHKD